MFNYTGFKAATLGPLLGYMVRSIVFLPPTINCMNIPLECMEYEVAFF